MPGTQQEEKKHSDQFFPTPPPGATHLAHEMLPTNVKEAPVGKIAHGLGNVGILTDAIETYQHNLSKGQAPVNAGIAAMASAVTEKLVEGVGASLVLAGAAVGTVAGAPILAPALVITSGALLMMKSKEAGDLANLAASHLVDASLDKFSELKTSLSQFIKKSYQKWVGDNAAQAATYPNIETAMVKLDYLQHLRDQGIYKNLDADQRLLYNWIARETFSDYFQLDGSGKLKSIKSGANIQEAKPNGGTVKLQLSDIYTSLKEVQKKCQLSPEAILGSKSVITDEELGKLLLSHGASPDEITSLYKNPEHVNIARHAITHLKEQQTQLSCAIEAERSLEIIQGTQHFFAALTQIGMFSRSEALMTVGQIGYHTMQMADSIVKLSSMPIGFSSLEPMHMLISAGLSLVSTVLGLGDDREEIEQKRAEQLHAALYAISRQIQELHGRFDHIENMLSHLDGKLNQILKNQKILSDQIRDTYKLVRAGFQLVQTMLHDMRAENRSSHEKTHQQLNYLIGMTEDDSLQQFKEEVADRIKYISDMAMAEEISDADMALLKKEFKQLQSDIKKACSSRWNGQKEFLAQQSTDTPRDLQLARQFLAHRVHDKDDGLGFIAEEIEQLTKIPLDTVGVKKELLPATSLWTFTVFNYLRLAQLPMFASLNNPSFMKEINAEADNLLKFIAYLKEHKVIELLLKQHQDSIKAFQTCVFDRFTLHKEDKTNETHKPKVMRIVDYFSKADDKVDFEKLKNHIDYQYFLLQRLGEIIGASTELQQQLALQDSSSNLLTQQFDFNEKPKPKDVGGYFDSIFTDYSLSPWRHLYPYTHEALEKFCGVIYGQPGQEKMLFTTFTAYSSDWNDGASASVSVNEWDVASGKLTNLNSTHPSYPNPAMFNLSEYKGNFNQSANHAWTSFHYVNAWNGHGPSLIWFSGGSGYVSILNMNGCQVFRMKNTGKQKISDEKHLYLYQDADNKIFYRMKGKNWYLDSIQLPHPFNFDQSEDNPRPFESTNPYLAAILKITTERGHTYPDYQWKTVPGSKPFNVPLDRQRTQPTMTCYTEIIYPEYLSSPYLLVTKVEWDREKNEAYVRFEVCDFLQNKWLKPDEINALFQHDVVSNNGWGWTLKGSPSAPAFSQHKIHILSAPHSLMLSPNQFFIKNMPYFGFSSLKGDVIYGLIKPNGDHLDVEMHVSRLGKFIPSTWNPNKKDAPTLIKKSLPIAVSHIYQTSSENVIVNDDSILTLISSVKTKDGTNKLLFVDANFRFDHYETHAFEIPLPHEIADWQAMRTVVKTVMGKPQIIVCLHDTEYHKMMFCYDPDTKTMKRLADGSPTEFVKPDERIDYGDFEECDPYLANRRKKYPGFYPVNTFSMQPSQLGNMDEVIISHPKPTGSSQYKIQVEHYPLAPQLKLHSTEEALKRLNSPEEKAAESTSKLAMSAQVTQELLKTHNEKKQVDVPKENLLQPAIESGKKIHKLMFVAMNEFKYNEAIVPLIQEENKNINGFLAELEGVTLSTANLNKGVTTLKSLYESIIQLNGYLNMNERYAVGVGKSVNQQIEQFKEKMTLIEKSLTKSPHVAKSMFSGKNTLPDSNNNHAQPNAYVKSK